MRGEFDEGEFVMSSHVPAEVVIINGMGVNLVLCTLHRILAPAFTIWCHQTRPFINYLKLKVCIISKTLKNIKKDLGLP